METTPVTPMPAAPAPQPVVSVMPKRRMNPAAVAGIVIVVALLGYGAYAYFTDSWPFAPAGEPMVSESPSPSATADPMAGWKTYTNSTLGLELKYPSDFSVKENTCTGRNCYTRLENGFAMLKIRANNPGAGAISVSKNSETGTVSIGGIPATYRFGQEVELGDESRPLQTWALVMSFAHGQDQYDLAFEYNEAHPGVYKEQVMLPILATLTFADTATGWKTYTSTLYGYTFSYPEGFTVVSPAVAYPQQDSTWPQFTCGSQVGVCANMTDQYRTATYGATHFGGAGFAVKILDKDPENLSTPAACATRQYGAEPVASPITQTTTVGGVSFFTFQADGAAAGTQVFSTVYRTFRGGKCWELSVGKVYHSGSDDPDLTGAQQKTLDDLLAQILSTFTFTK